MWYPSTVTAAPTVEPVTLAQAKASIRVDHDLEDVLIGDMIAQARAHIEKRCNACFATQTMVSTCDAFADLARLPHGPLVSVSSISYRDLAGDTQDVADTVFVALKDGLEPSIALNPRQTWPAALPGSRITLTAVYGGTAPLDIQRAILLLVGAWYENREATVIGTIASPLPVSVGLDALVCNHCRGA